MLRTINTAERGITPNGAAILVVAQNVSTEAIPSQVNQPYVVEISGRYVQNLGANALYYAFGQGCSPTNCHGVLQQYQQLDCSAHRLSVNVFCSVSGGTTAAICLLFRNDVGNNNSIAQ